MARVLIVDDSPEYRDILTGVAQSRGWEAEAREDAGSALESIRAALPDLVILDLALPDMDGFAFCKRIRADEALAWIPVLMVTGTYRKDEDRLRGMESGADDYIVKPFRVAELVEKAESLIQRGERRRKE